MFQKAGVEVCTVGEGGNAYKDRLAHCEQRHNDLIDELQVAVGRLLQYDDRSTNALESLRQGGGGKSEKVARGKGGTQDRSRAEMEWCVGVVYKNIILSFYIYALAQ